MKFNSFIFILQVDVIVNSVGTHLSLQCGGCAQAIATAAGDDLQAELYSKSSPSGAALGDVYVTRGYKLPCKYVLHAICYPYDPQHAVQNLQAVLQKILAEADKLHAKSIAIPPLGAGNLGYPNYLVARTIAMETSSYIRTQKGSSLTEIRLVVPSSNSDLIQAFRKIMEQDGRDVVESTDQDTKAAIKALKKSRREAAGRRLSFPAPHTWVSAESGKDYDRYIVHMNSPEYSAVINNIRQSAGEEFSGRIYQIERVENLLLYQMYEMTKSMLLQRSTACDKIERMLWHGTDVKALDSICRYGFNRAYCGKNGVLYGKGVYCARDFRYSARDQYSPPDSNFMKHVIQCRVLTGEFTAGKEDMIVAPEKSPGVQYDSTVDDEKNPQIFVVFLDYRMYPEYIISFFTCQ